MIPWVPISALTAVPPPVRADAHVLLEPARRVRARPCRGRRPCAAGTPSRPTDAEGTVVGAVVHEVEHHAAAEVAGRAQVVDALDPEAGEQLGVPAQLAAPDLIAHVRPRHSVEVGLRAASARAGSASASRASLAHRRPRPGDQEAHADQQREQRLGNAAPQSTRRGRPAIVFTLPPSCGPDGPPPRARGSCGPPGGSSPSATCAASPPGGAERRGACRVGRARPPGRVARAAGSPGGTSRPSTWSRITNGMPPTADPTTGQPLAIASTSVIPNDSDSVSDGQHGHSRPPVEARQLAVADAAVPVDAVGDPEPLGRSLRAETSSPSPTMSSRTSGTSSRSRTRDSTSTWRPFQREVAPPARRRGPGARAVQPSTVG